MTINVDNLNNFMIDVLKELGNIGAGNAATALANMISKKIDMKVPNVRIMEFRVIVLPATKYLLFIGEPFPEEAYCEAIETVQQAIHNFNPQAIGAQWDVSNPRIQLEPIGNRGYMELMPIQ